MSISLGLGGVEPRLRLTGRSKPDGRQYSIILSIIAGMVTNVKVSNGCALYALQKTRHDQQGAKENTQPRKDGRAVMTSTLWGNRETVMYSKVNPEDRKS